MARSGQDGVVFGVHVGNTSTCLACNKDGKTQVIANDAGDRLTPATLGITETEKIVGTPAKANMGRNNSCIIVHNKRLLDDSLPEEEVEVVKNGTPYKISREGNCVKYTFKHGDGTSTITAESVAVHIFMKLYEIACSSGQSDGDIKVVLCVPMHFPRSSRVTMLRAAEEAGFEVLHVIAEPAAAALAYNIGFQSPEEENMMCLVFRVGGASLDVNIIEANAGMYSLVQGEHTNNLGGDKFTRILAEYLGEEFKKKCKLDPHDSRRSMAKLIAAAETCKHILSTVGTAHCFIESLCEGVDFSYNISRARFESLISPVIPSFTNLINEVIMKANLDSKHIQKVLLCGGSVRMPKMQKAVRDLFPEAEVLIDSSPDEIIAIGAAKHGSYLSEAVDSECQHLSREIPATSIPICIRSSLIGPYCIIPAFTPVPVHRFKRYMIQANVPINFEFLEGSLEDLKNSKELGKVSLPEVPHPSEISLEVGLSSVGGLTAILCDLGNKERKSTLKVEPAQQ